MLVTMDFIKTKNSGKLSSSTVDENVTSATIMEDSTEMQNSVKKSVM